MTLKERLASDMKEAMKAREAGKARLGVIRFVRGAIRQVEIDQRVELDDEGVRAVIAKEVKQRRESIAEFQKGGRDDLVAQNEADVAVLMEYLPAQLDAAAIAALVAAAIAESGAQTAGDIGKVMKILMPQVKGKADGKLVNQMVREALAKS